MRGAAGSPSGSRSEEQSPGWLSSQAVPTQPWPTFPPAVSFLLVQFIVCILCEFMNWDIHGKHVRAVLLIHLWKVSITEDMGMESVGFGFMF